MSIIFCGLEHRNVIFPCVEFNLANIGDAYSKLRVDSADIIEMVYCVQFFFETSVCRTELFSCGLRALYECERVHGCALVNSRNC